MGNVDDRAYVTTADWRIPLTDLGKKQAEGEYRVVFAQYSPYHGAPPLKNSLV